MATISKADAIDALRRLGELASESASRIELIILGGGAMILGFDARQSTRDLDVIVISPLDRSLLRNWAHQIADERGWPDDWLNDAAKGFVVGLSDGGEVFSARGISVRRPATEQLLAMKLCAWRDDLDIADARRLLMDLKGNRAAVWQRLEQYLQPGRELLAKYAFDDLWESLHDKA